MLLGHLVKSNQRVKLFHLGAPHNERLEPLMRSFQSRINGPGSYLDQDFTTYGLLRLARMAQVHRE